MILIEESRSAGGPVFALRGEGFAYVMRVTPEGLLQHVHYGAVVGSDVSQAGLAPRVSRENAAWHEDAPHSSLNALAQEYPVAGASDYRHCALDADTADGLPVGTLTYRAHGVRDGAPDLGGLPVARGEGARTLTVTMADPVTGLVADLHYTVWPDQGVLARAAVLRNEGGAAITLRRVLSACLSLPPGCYEALHLHGSWAHEFQVERVPLPSAELVVRSARGTSSAAHHPFLALLSPGTTETAGEVVACTLIYSGNHRHTAERGEYQDARLSAGIEPGGFAWRLDPGQRFATPQALSVFAQNGLGGMSRIWHRFVRDRVSPPRWRDRPRPTYLNSWEAAYFDVDEDKVLRLADRAARLGLDMIVLDDGWFEGRTGPQTGLGSWQADRARFPAGIDGLASRVRAKGLLFGLWFEPEMASPDSALLRDHPDWVLRVPGRRASVGRHQLTLDLGQAQVRAHVYEALAAHLRGGDIAYVKWDMNRPMTDVRSAALPPERQREAAHRYVLGLYEVLGRLTADFPDVLFEACASGGNRFDLGMLSYCAQGWLSDMVDPVGRAAIVSGASLLYPTDVMAAYVGPSPNHQNGRLTGLEARFDAGVLLAAQGVSLNEEALDADEAALRALFAGAKAAASRRLGARFDRLLTAANETIWQQTSTDGRHVVVLDLHVLARPNAPLRTARLRGLDPAAGYRDASGVVRTGAVLMNAGLPLPQVGLTGGEGAFMPPGDFATALIELERVT